MNDLEFRGAYTALITPFRAGAIDYPTLERLVEEQLAAGIAGLVAVGSTGESATLDMDEHVGAIAAVVRAVKGRVPVLGGTGANSTKEAIALVRGADAVGVDAHLQVAPYYNKPSQEGVFRHFAAIAEATTKPIMLYNIPGRCGIEISVDVVRRLAEAYPHVNSVKEAGGTVVRVTALRRECPQVTVICGDDGLTLPFVAAGARGVVSVASNLAPRPIVELTEAALRGDHARALELHERYYELLTDLVFLDGNPVTIKTAMHVAGKLPHPEMRLPLVPPNAATTERIRQLVSNLDLSHA